MSSGGSLVAAVLLAVTLAVAMSVDVVRAGFGIKGDEATYVAMTLSAAYDHDLRFERRDLERFWGLYRTGPEGIFLKRGKEWRTRIDGSPPFLHIDRSQTDSHSNRLYFGKALIYALAAAPFVRVLGMNGFLVLHVLLLGAVGVCGYRFLSARLAPAPAVLFTVGFMGATVLPVYVVFLTPEILNFTLVFLVYFLWLYKEVATDGGGTLGGFGSDLAAAALLGSATYSKPTNLPLVLPLVALFLWRRRFDRGLILGLAFAATTAGWFGANALNSGEFNYQGGDRKTFYGRFPFDAPDAVWDNRGDAKATNDADTDNVLDASEFVGRLSHNVEYFLVGRHFGFVPYFFPGVVAIGLWLASRERWTAWRVFSMVGLAGATLGLLVLLPDTWSGGGGPPGNRYFLSLYPTLFFITPPMASSVPALIAWVGGALVTAKMVTSPFVAAKFTWEMSERGWARRLPVELTMANDLPAMLAQPMRAPILYGHEGDRPTVKLYFLDQHAYPPERDGMWIAGDGRADIIVRTDEPLHHLAITAFSPIRTVLIVSAGAATHTVPIAPQTEVSFDLPVSGVKGLRSWEYLLSARSTEGFTPHLLDPTAQDGRNLGVQMRFKAVIATP